jgi:hypothetical protein
MEQWMDAWKTVPCKMRGHVEEKKQLGDHALPRGVMSKRHFPMRSREFKRITLGSLLLLRCIVRLTLRIFSATQATECSTLPDMSDKSIRQEQGSTG